MKKILLITFLLLLMTLSLSACKKESASPDSAPEKADIKEEIKKPTDLTGTWVSEVNENSWMEAVITADTISVDWVSDNGDTKSIYWIGTYTSPTEYVTEYSWTSERDKEQTDTALLASTDDTKEFSYSEGKISYEVSMMGTTTRIELTKK